MHVDLTRTSFDRGGYLLVKRALRSVAAGGEVTVTGASPELEVHLRAWCRAEGHSFRWDEAARVGIVTCGEVETSRWSGSQRAGSPNPLDREAVVDHPPRHWGLAARGALVEAGSPEFDFRLVEKEMVWADDVPRLYAQAVVSQWDPNTAVPWDAAFDLPSDIEDAVVQVMTYLIENETAALIVPSRFIAQLHPHFREVMQLLAVQAADEARHIEVFTRRALLKRTELGRSTSGGQASLKTLVDEPDFAIASFLLSVLGEGTFLSLLRFLEVWAPDPVTAAVVRLAAQDEARHVAFGIAHLRTQIRKTPELRVRLAAAVHSRHEALRHTAGLNAEVFDSLLLLAAGSWDPADIRLGHQRVLQLAHDMNEGRTLRMLRLGFSEEEAASLAELHTRNFM